MSSSGRILDGRYALGERVGSGGMADVHRGFDQLLQRDVAIKMLRSSGLDEVARARFRSEATTLAGLNHPGIVTLLDAGIDAATDPATDPGQPYLVMELVPGPTLGRRLHESGPMSPEQVRSWGAQVAGALDYAHGLGLVHRDVKPGNLLLQPDGRAVLTDFGIARLVAADAEHTRTGEVIGSAAYLAPEQVNGAPLSYAVDVYALGLVLLEALTNVRAYPGTPVEAALARLTSPPLIPPWVDADLAALITEMTALDPDARPTAAEVAARLHGARVLPDPLPEATAVLAVPPLPSRRRPGAPVLAVAGAAVALVLAGLTQIPGEPDTPLDPVTPAGSVPSSTPSAAPTAISSPRRAPVATVASEAAAAGTKAAAPTKAKAPKKAGKVKGKGKGQGRR